jgi:hypothetical protein
MNLTKLLKLSLRKTVFAIIISALLSLLLSLLVIYIDRIVNSNSIKCGDVAFCLVHTNVLLGIGFSTLNDLAVITRYIFELSVIFLIAQAIYRIIKRN